MADITITASTRSLLFSAEQTYALSARTNRRLSSGQRVNAPTDQASVFFLAKTLTEQASDLLGVKDNINHSLSLVGASINDVKYLTQLINQLKSVAADATGTSQAARAEQAAKFDEIRAQLDSMAADAEFAGVNLIGAPPDDHTISLNPDGSSMMTISGIASDSASLGIGSAQGAYNNFATDADVQSAFYGLEQAFAALRSTEKTLGANAGTLNTRLNYTQDLANTLAGGAARLTGADMNAEAANALALNISRQLSQAGLSLVNANQQAILQLF